jgi:hypothetical protein
MDQNQNKGLLPQGRYLTFTPNGGLLATQLLELEIAVQLANQSGRRLFLPPFINSDASRIYDQDKVLWSHIIDMDDLAERVDVLDGGHRVIPATFSELTLSVFNRHNTQWYLNDDLAQEEYCLSDFVTKSNVERHTSTSIVDRSARCLFESTKDVNVLRFVDLIGTFRTESSLPLQVRYAKVIRDAAHKIWKTIAGNAATGGLYTCLQLQGGVVNPATSSDDPDAISPIITEVEAYLSQQNTANNATLYVVRDFPKATHRCNCLPLNILCADMPVQGLQPSVGRSAGM